MYRFFFVLVLSVSLWSCNDGDVVDFEFEFGDDFSSCGSDDILFFKTKQNPTETVTVAISDFTLEDIFTTEPDSTALTINENATFTYRTYNRENLPSDLFCSNIPPSNLNIEVDQSSAVTAILTRILMQDDEDGIPANLEGQDPNRDGDFSDALDTDKDGIPDYLDEDDDGDNIPTRLENPDPNDDGNLDDAQNSDDDEIPDYLDRDDDNDGVLTRDEESVSQDQNPTNDQSQGNTPDYLNENITNAVPATAFRVHTVQTTFRVDLRVTDISIDFISQDNFDFGSLVGASELRRATRDTLMPLFPPNE